MNPQGILEQLEQSKQALTRGNTQLKTLSIKKAEAEKIIELKKHRKY